MLIFSKKPRRDSVSMSRKSKRNKNQRKQEQLQQKLNHVKRFQISMSDWERYERFRDNIPQLQSLLYESTTGLKTHIEWLKENLGLSDLECEELILLLKKLGNLSKIITKVEGDRPVIMGPKSGKGKKKIYVAGHISNKDKVGDKTVINNVKNKPLIAEIYIEDITEDLHL